MNVGYKFFHLVFLLFFILQAHYSMGKRRLPAKWKEKVDKTCRRLNNMFPVYEEKKESLHLRLKASGHASSQDTWMEGF